MEHEVDVNLHERMRAALEGWAYLDLEAMREAGRREQAKREAWRARELREDWVAPEGAHARALQALGVDVRRDLGGDGHERLMAALTDAPYEPNRVTVIKYASEADLARELSEARRRGELVPAQ